MRSKTTQGKKAIHEFMNTRRDMKTRRHEDMTPLRHQGIDTAVHHSVWSGTLVRLVGGAERPLALPSLSLSRLDPSTPRCSLDIFGDMRHMRYMRRVTSTHTVTRHFLAPFCGPLELS